MKKSVHLCLLILKLSKKLMYNVWYDLCKTKIWWKNKVVLYG